MDDNRIARAKLSLQTMLDLKDLRGKRFLDVGSGSGLFSLAARELGASVLSYDFDSEAVACTKSVRNRYFQDDSEWEVLRGNVLDQQFLKSLDTFDIVYSWGVLHHTGSLWIALQNTATMVKENGYLFIAIYNDQGPVSRYWLMVKKIFNSNRKGRVFMILLHAPYLYVLRRIVRFIKNRGELPRGMDLWRDMIDWLGGLPFEVAKPDEIIRFSTSRGFQLVNLQTCGHRHGCNEFVFRKQSQ